jgi:hypothetical protein
MSDDAHPVFEPIPPGGIDPATGLPNYVLGQDIEHGHANDYAVIMRNPKVKFADTEWYAAQDAKCAPGQACVTPPLAPKEIREQVPVQPEFYHSPIETGLSWLGAVVAIVFIGKKGTELIWRLREQRRKPL